MRIHALEHVSYESLGHLETWAPRRGHVLGSTRLYFDEPLPQPEDFDGLVIMGGTMSVHDRREHPWLVEEKRWISNVIASGKRVLGICLGAQLVAEVLGARVSRNPQREIGWFPIRWTPAGRDSALFASLPERPMVLQWHEDTFDLPRGAIHLAESDLCRHQAFTWGDNVCGLQFHLQMTAEDVQRLGEHEEIESGPFVQSPQEILARREHFDSMHAMLDIVLDRFWAGTQVESARPARSLPSES